MVYDWWEEEEFNPKSEAGREMKNTVMNSNLIDESGKRVRWMK